MSALGDIRRDPTAPRLWSAAWPLIAGPAG
jgi:hypothetical protein